MGWVKENERPWEFCVGCNQRRLPDKREFIEPQISFDTQPLVPHLALPVSVLRRTFLPVVLDHGRRNVPELLGGEGYQVVEEVWWMWVSDRRSYRRVLDHCSSPHFLMTF